MSEASSMSVSLNIPNDRKSKLSRMLTLERLIEWINAQELDEFTTKGLIDIAKRYPSHALPTFKKNFNIMLQRVRSQRKAEDVAPVVEIVEETPSDEETLNSEWK